VPSRDVVPPGSHPDRSRCTAELARLARSTGGGCPLPARLREVRVDEHLRRASRLDLAWSSGHDAGHTDDRSPTITGCTKISRAIR